MPANHGSEHGSYAAIDLGSNSFHLILARRSGGQLQIVDRLRDMVRLGAGLTDSGRLSEATQLRALDALRRFGERLREVPPAHIRAVGTYTLRQAHGRGHFLQRAGAVLGHPVEVISGQEEARLIYRGVNFAQGPAAGRRLIIDVGGGSTEFALGERAVPHVLESLDMGCVTYSRRFFDTGKISRRRWKAAKIAAELELQPVRQAYRDHGWDEAIGTSGSVRAIAGVLEALGQGSAITAAGLQRLEQRLIEIGQIERVELPGLSAERQAVFVGGVIILQAAFEQLGIEAMSPGEGALREGLLDELMMVGGEDVRQRTVEAWFERYHVDRAQAQRVATTALHFFEAVRPQHLQAPPELGEMLRHAAELHEVGLAVAHSGYHRHGHYLLTHGALAGFSRENQLLIAALVRNHRRRPAPELFSELPDFYRDHAMLMAVLLRLAVLLHRSRVPDGVPAVALEPRPGGLKLHFPAGWLDQRPLIEADLAQEAQWLKAAGFKLKYGERDAQGASRAGTA